MSKRITVTGAFSLLRATPWVAGSDSGGVDVAPSTVGGAHGDEKGLLVHESDLSAAGLAQVWADKVSQTTYLAMSGAETEQFLARLLAQLVKAVSTTPVDERAASEVAAELVANHLTGSRSLRCTIAILGEGLPRLPELRDIDGRDGAVLRVLAALSAGYTESLRRRTLDEQEEVAQALLRAKLEAEARFREVFLASTVGIAISTFDGTVVNANQALADIVDRPPADLIGAALPELLQAEHDRGLAKAYRKLTTGEQSRFRYRRQSIAASGELAWTHLGGSLLRDADGVATHCLTIVENINELHLLQQELSRQALHDVLTGLPNERYLISRLEEVLETAGPSTQVTLCRIQLDNFWVINDGIGLAAGDALLCSIARRLGELAGGPPAMVARLGGGDFAILIEDGPNNPEPRVLGASINEALSEPDYLDENGLAVSASVGVVRRPAMGLTPAELISSASTTMHRARRTGAGQWSLYDRDAEARERADYRLAAVMPGAFENGEVTLNYQPVCQLGGGGIVAIQALLHWTRADGTVADHLTSLTLAEQSGLLGQLGRWIVQESCRTQSQVLADPACGAPLLRVDLTMNLSQDPDLIAILNGALSDAGLAAEQLRIGIPMLALAHRRGDVVDNIDVLTQLGAELVMLSDVAGLGYLAFLEDFPLSAVELHPGIVARIAARPGESSVVAQAVRAAIPLIHDTGAIVIVSGIDSPEQAKWWRDAGADSARGAYFGAPVPASELPILLHNAFPDHP